MKKIILVFSIAFSFGLAFAQSSSSGLPTLNQPAVVPDWFKTTFLDIQEDIEEAAEAGRTLVLFFNQEGCPYCAAMLGKNFKDERVKNIMVEKFDTIEINIWGDREVIGIDGQEMIEKDFSASLEVQFTPTMIFLDSNGKVIHRLDGFWRLEPFLELIKGIGQKGASTSAVKSKGGGAWSPIKKAATGKFDFRKTNKPIALIIESPDCVECPEWRKILELPKTQESLILFSLVSLNSVDDPTYLDKEGKERKVSDLMKKYDSEGYFPAMFLFSKEGQLVIHKTSLLRAFHTQSLFEYVGQGFYKEMPQFQRYINYKVERMKEEGAQEINIAQ